MSNSFIENDTMITAFHRVIQSYILMRKPGPFGARGRPQDGLIYILEGDCTYTFPDGKRFVARKGDVLYLARGAVYQMEVARRYEFIFCDFDFQGTDLRQSRVITPRHTEEMARLFRKLKHCYDAGGAASHAACLGILYGICAALIQETQPVYVGSGSRRRIEAARQWMDTHVNDVEVTVAALAQQAQMSEVHFRKLFAELYGLPPSQYLQAARVAYAKELMRAGFLTLEEVALQSGFASQPYFSRVFKQLTGQTPAAWRREQAASRKNLK